MPVDRIDTIFPNGNLNEHILPFLDTITLTKIDFIGVVRFIRTPAEVCFLDTTAFRIKGNIL